MNDEAKEIILDQIRLARKLFLKHKEQDNYSAENAWYYLGVFDALVGLYYGEEESGLEPIDGENLTDYLSRTTQEFLNRLIS